MKNRNVSGRELVDNILTVKAVLSLCALDASSHLWSFPLDEISLYDHLNGLVFLRSGYVLHLDEEYVIYVGTAMSCGNVGLLDEDEEQG